MLMEALSKVHTDIPTYSHQFVKSLVCDPPTEQCWNNMCDECKDGKLFNFTFDGEVSIKWFQWEKQLSINNKKQLQKIEESGAFDGAVSKLKSQIPSFILHHSIKHKQSSAYKDHKL